MDEESSLQEAPTNNSDENSSVYVSNSPLRGPSSSAEIQSEEQSNNGQESAANSVSSSSLTILNNEELDSRSQSPTHPTSSDVASARR